MTGVAPSFFCDNAKAGSGVFSINGGAVEGANGGTLAFYNNTNASSAVITTRGSGVLDSTAGQTTFYDTSSAGSQPSSTRARPRMPLLPLTRRANLFFTLSKAGR